MPTIKITEPVRAAALRRPFAPSVTKDNQVRGLALHVTTRRSFWALTYQIRGVNPATGRRYGGGTRHELADAQLVGVAEARGLALAAKAVVRAGGDPLHAHLASRARVEASRAALPASVGESLDAYERALMARRQPTEWSRKQSIRYARLAVVHMNASALPIAAINTRMVRLLVETAPGADAQVRHIFGGLSRFLSWAVKQELLEHNPCAALDRHDRPKRGKSRDHVPSLEALRAVWAAAETEPTRDLVRFMLLLPLRRSEASGLTWREVDFNQCRVRISASRTKNSEVHELPLSAPALALLASRKASATGDLVFPSSKGTPFSNWAYLLRRIRQRIGEGEFGKDDRFSFHDTRRAFVSHLAGSFDVDALDRCLGHRRAGVAGVYQRSARWPERVAALNAYADLITGEAEPDSNVLPFGSVRKVI